MLTMQGACTAWKQKDCAAVMTAVSRLWGKVAHRACALQSIWFESFAFDLDGLVLVREQAPRHVW